MSLAAPGRFLSLVGLLALGLACSSEPSLEQLIERNTEAMGGRERLEQLRSVQVVRNANMITLTMRPHFHKVEVFDADGRLQYAEGFDGHVAWEQTTADTARRRVTGRPAKALWRVLQWPSPLNPLYRLPSQSHSLSLLGDTIFDETRYHRLLLTLSDGFEREYFLNADTYLIERARDHRRLHAIDDTTQNIEGIWGDFRDLDGYVFPFYSEERNFDTGERFYGSTILDIRVNAEVPETEFGLEGVSRPDVLHAIVRQRAPTIP